MHRTKVCTALFVIALAGCGQGATDSSSTATNTRAVTTALDGVWRNDETPDFASFKDGQFDIKVGTQELKGPFSVSPFGKDGSFKLTIDLSPGDDQGFLVEYSAVRVGNRLMFPAFTPTGANKHPTSVVGSWTSPAVIKFKMHLAAGPVPDVPEPIGYTFNADHTGSSDGQAFGAPGFTYSENRVGRVEITPNDDPKASKQILWIFDYVTDSVQHTVLAEPFFRRAL
jgi:hypothetical protein